MGGLSFRVTIAFAERLNPATLEGQAPSAGVHISDGHAEFLLATCQSPHSVACRMATDILDVSVGQI